jgi:hypothetical protein
MFSSFTIVFLKKNGFVIFFVIFIPGYLDFMI